MVTKLKIYKNVKISFKYILILKRRICEFFMIRDYTHIQDLMLFQYNVEKNESK